MPVLDDLETAGVETVITDGIVDNDEAASAVTYIQVRPELHELQIVPETQLRVKNKNVLVWTKSLCLKSFIRLKAIR